MVSLWYVDCLGVKNVSACRDCWSCTDADTGMDLMGICVYLCMPEASHHQVETKLLLNGRDHMLTNMRKLDHARWQRDVKAMKHWRTHV
jgi:hypothetical protein